MTIISQLGNKLHSKLKELLWSESGHTIDTDHVPDTQNTHSSGLSTYQWLKLWVSTIENALSTLVLRGVGTSVVINTDDLTIGDGAGDHTTSIDDGDWLISCESNKTIELVETVWEDVNLGGPVLSSQPGQQPGRVNFLSTGGTDTGIATFGVAVGEGVDGSLEIPHDYKEGTDIAFHVHFQGITAPTGTDKAQWQLKYAIGVSGVALAGFNTITIECDVDTQYGFYVCSFADITGTTIDIGDQFLFNLQRIAASADEYAGEALLATVGVHYQVNTLGSREIFTK